MFFPSFFGRKGKKGSNASNASDKQKRINQLLNASHNSQAEKDYLRSRILEIFEEDEKAIQKELEEQEKTATERRQRKHASMPAPIIEVIRLWSS